jgi:putative membrane protein
MFGGENPMKRILAVACGLSFCSIVAVAVAASGSGMSDQQFVDFAAQTDMVEANLGQFAQSAASSQDVKDYGQMLVTDHTDDYNKLYGIAQQAGLNVPNAIGAAQNKQMIDPFQKLQGKAFDRRYAAEMIAGHTKAIAIYKKEAASAQSPALKSYAEQTLPTLEKHLDGAKNLQKGK